MFLLALSALAFVAPASAQVQRSFINLSFEQPNLVTPGCRVYIAASQVPGWNTTHPNAVAQNVGGCIEPAGFAQTAPILELWRTPRDNGSGGPVNARSGTQIAELNADVASRIYQNVCLINGERVAWRFSHRGRGSATTPDLAELKVGASAAVVRVGTTNSGVFSPVVVSQGTANPPVNAAGNPTWVDYAGAFTYAGATGSTNIGFEAIGGTTSGNLLDDIQIAVAPFAEFSQPSSSSPEGTGGNLPRLRINGTVASAFSITVQVTGGTATLGTDYHTPGDSTTFTVAVPAGAYDGGAASEIALPVIIVNDAVGEPNETIVFGIVAPSPVNPPFLLASSNTCGGAVQTVWTYTIVDDDARITLSKNAAAPVPVSGNAALADVTYTIVVSNPSASTAANYSLADMPGLDADVSVVSAGYALNGGSATALSGSGPWTLQPQWRTLAAGATDTYVLTARIRVNRGGVTTNDACAAPSAAGSGLHNAVQAVVQGSSGNPNTNFAASACRSTPTPVWATLSKMLEGRAVSSDQAQVRIYSGGLVNTVATTSGGAAPASATTGLVVLAAGSTMQFEEAIKANGTGADQNLGNYRPQIACTNGVASSTVLPSGAGTDVGNRQQWAEFTPAAGDDLACLISNALPRGDLAITKTNNATSLVSGTTTTYEVKVTNNGPEEVRTAILRDPAPTGLSNCTFGTPACSATPGSTCPGAALTIVDLQGAGVPVPLLANGGSVTIRLACTVN